MLAHRHTVWSSVGLPSAFDLLVIICPKTFLVFINFFKSIDHDTVAAAMSGVRLNRKERPQLANRAKHRLRSIQYDVETLLEPFVQAHPDWPILSNERCGHWYTEGLKHRKIHSCCFKSTDGHYGVWNLSLKRLNLPVVDRAARHGCVLLVDSSVKKELPDSWSRTLPVWACALNRVALRFREDLGLPSLPGFDTTLHVPGWIISDDEKEQIDALLPDRVAALYQSKAIVNIPRFLDSMKKPLRPFFVNREHPLEVEPNSTDPFVSIICLHCSEHVGQRGTWMQGFWYTPGAADDDDLWGFGLTPKLFWSNLDSLLDEHTDEDEVDQRIQSLVSRTSLESQDRIEDCFDWLGETNLAIGSRRAGRPPECWHHFDAILNVSMNEYDSVVPDDKFYLQLPVEEGKRDRTELERWLAVGVAFVLAHAPRRVLIHCAQGRDRSVAVALAVILSACEPCEPLRWKKPRASVATSVANVDESADNEESRYYLQSGLDRSLVSLLLEPSERQPRIESLLVGKEVSKESIRVHLQLIKVYRTKADPSRSTMQKLHRFFLSDRFKQGTVSE